jgi:midasin (ATPase involved in ribosome maturation)
MNYRCTTETNLHDLIGCDSQTGFQYGPLAVALRNGDELVLEASHLLPLLTAVKIRTLIGNLFIVETEEILRPSPGFRLVLA